MPQDFLVPQYKEMVTKHQAAWAQLMGVVCDPQKRPVLFHCDTGKDRAGVAAALVLLGGQTATFLTIAVAL